MPYLIDFRKNMADLAWCAMEFALVLFTVIAWYAAIVVAGLFCLRVIWFVLVWGWWFVCLLLPT